MANMDVLMRSLSFIEAHLTENLQTEDIARSCYASKSSLEKMFRFSTHFSVHDYIIRRRMTRAARMMMENPQLSLLDVAMEFGYSSHEAFTRAFEQVWKCTPTEYRASQNKRLHPMELFPQVSGFVQYEGEPYMRKTVDISELYDFFTQRKDNYFVCCDIIDMIGINNVSRTAGDIALLEVLKRMNDCSSDDDVAFRIGCDEFALLTNSTDEAYANKIRDKILAMNGQLIPYKDAEVPLNLYATVVKIDQKHIRYNEMFDKLSITYEQKKAQREGK